MLIIFIYHFSFSIHTRTETGEMSSMEDPINMEKLEANIKFRRAQSVRRVIKVSILSIPIISILSNSSWIPHPSSLSSQILHGFHSFHSTTLQSITSSLWNTDRGVMFFLCNVILLFLIIKDSGMIRVGPSADDIKKIKILVREETHELGSMEDGSGAIVVLDDEEEELEEYVECLELEEYVECLELVVVDEAADVECLELVVVDEAAKEVNEVPDEIMDKMFDEFIERFKRERRMEALQLVVV